MADTLDKKVFKFGDGFIYASNAMKDYYVNAYNITDKDAYIIPYVLGKEVADTVVDQKLKQKLKMKLGLEEDDFVFFFAGGYKATAGVQDLISAFARFIEANKKGKLILIGTGPTRNECLKLIETFNIHDRIILIDKIPYIELPTYQSLANVVVCPDRQNPYSQLIVHLKYFDALASGAIVINGAFDSVKEINKDDFLSLTFKPSSVESLFQKMDLSFRRYEEIKIKYSGTKNYALKKLTYEDYVAQLE